MCQCATECQWVWRCQLRRWHIGMAQQTNSNRATVPPQPGLFTKWISARNSPVPLETMTEQIKYEYRQAARERWGNRVEISGAGAWAVISRCQIPLAVRLFETRSEAFATSRQPCGSKCKSNYHDWLQLELPAPRFIRKPHWARDLDRD